jgi:hypothetical protein
VPELKVTVNCRSMLISTQFFRFCKGLEHFYYALLFTSEPYASNGAEPWLSWLQGGFHVAAREAPPAAAANDQLRVETRPGRSFELRAASSNGKALEKLRDLVREVDRVRSGLGAQPDRDRLKVIAADAKIGAILLTPLKSALARHSIPADGVDQFVSMIDRGLLAACDQQITSIETALS